MFETRKKNKRKKQKNDKPQPSPWTSSLPTEPGSSSTTGTAGLPPGGASRPSGRREPESERVTVGGGTVFYLSTGYRNFLTSK